MRTFKFTFTTFLILLIIICIVPTIVRAQGKDFSIETISAKCKGIKREDRVRITVTRFSVSSRAAQATGQFGDELTAIMTNALQQTNCFRVLESSKNKADLEDEAGYNESGATIGNGPQRGKQMGAQAIVTAEITEYNDGNSSASFVGLSVGNAKAKIGVIVKVIDPETRDILWSKSINGIGKKGGFTGASLFGFNFAGSTTVSEAMSAAIEDLTLKTVELMVNEKEEIIGQLPDPSIGLAAAKVWNKENCTVLKGVKSPKVMVIIPEYHIQMPIPDPAGETEVIRKLLEAGFKVIDPSVYATIKTGLKFKDAAKDPMVAVALGRDFGADIVIFGEAFSQAASRDNGIFTCRARVEAKAVRTDNAEIIATNGGQAGGQDIAESTAAKSALRNAGSMLVDYLLGQFCKSDLSFSKATTNIKTVSAKSESAKSENISSKNANSTNVSITGISFTKFNNLIIKLLKETTIQNIKDKSLKGNAGSFIVSHTCSIKELSKIIDKLKNEIGFEYIVN
jgi:curli biogenesis system outer membrane secretion channel CsgG